MQILSILKGVATFSLNNLGTASEVVGMFNQPAGLILAALARTAAAVETQSKVSPMTSVDKKTAFASAIGKALEEQLGDKATPEMIAAAGPAIEDFIAFANKLAAMAAEAPTGPGIAPTAEVETPTLTQSAPKS